MLEISFLTLAQEALAWDRSIDAEPLAAATQRVMNKLDSRTAKYEGCILTQLFVD